MGPARRRPTKIEVEITAVVPAPMEAVFQRIADVSEYRKWLRRSFLYRGTRRSGTPQIGGRGAQFLDHTTVGTLHGTITEYVEPTRIAFEQILERGGRTVFVSQPSYTLSPHGQGTSVRHHGQAHLFHRWKILTPIAYVIANVERRRIVASLRRSFVVSRSGQTSLKR